VITEKTSQAKDVRAAVGSRYGSILAAEGHLLDLLEPGDVVPAWKRWTTTLLRPEGFYGTRPAIGRGQPFHRTVTQPTVVIATHRGNAPGLQQFHCHPRPQRTGGAIAQIDDGVGIREASRAGECATMESCSSRQRFAAAGSLGEPANRPFKPDTARLGPPDLIVGDASARDENQ